MNYPTITIQGNILSAELLEELERDAPHQDPRSFGLDGVRVKDEIARAWGEALLQWKVFQSKKARLKEGATGTTETRQFWIVPLLDTLGYRLTPQQRAEVVGEQTYFISHRDEEVDGFPVHVVGFADSLDRRRETGGPRLSPHALVQEYLNLTEHLYAVVTNGYHLRLLRDASRLTRLSYLEFDLVRMMEEEVFPDFAVLYRLLHRTRMPASQAEAEISVIEQYHQNALEAGARIRARLSEAVREGIQRMAGALLQDPHNTELRRMVIEEEVSALDLYTQLLRLIYRLLFLFVIEERNLVFEAETDGEAATDGTLSKREVYRAFYSVDRLRRLAENAHLADGQRHDLWISLFHTFRLFESRDVGGRLGIEPLDGELFGADALNALLGTRLRNDTLLYALGRLTRFRNDPGEWVRVNYAALNVEEFGSVYEGLLEFQPYVDAGASVDGGAGWSFAFREGDARSTTGSHYTPDELVRPLVEHALDPVIEQKTAGARKRGDAQAAERALLSLKVCDVACGSGHFLLAAARRIAHELARVRTGEEQPNPEALRRATREVIGHCIYGVDKNPMAVELCKVALWLEAHDPGKPLSFLDHRIKCGDSIVGLARAEDLYRGIPDEAFTRLDRDDKDVAKTLRDRNKKERKQRETGALQLALGDEVSDDLGEVARQFRRFEALPDETLEQRQAKEQAFATLSGSRWWRLKQIADAQTAPFFIPRTPANRDAICTDGPYRRALHSRNVPYDAFIHKAAAVALEKRFFHWFLEFPEVFDQDGFDCILGNPPFLGGQKLSGTFGHDYLNWLKTEYTPAGAIDLVGFFFRRIFGLLREGGAMGCIATNTIAQGNTREGGLAVIERESGAVNFAVRSMRWPGVAALEVALLTIQKSAWKGPRLLDGRPVDTINSYLADEAPLGDPHKLDENADKSFQGSIVLGMGFVLEPEEAKRLIEKDSGNAEVLFPYLNGEDLNSRPDQSPSRWAINFFDWPLEKAQQYSDCFQIVEAKVKPERLEVRYSKNAREYWWLYERYRPELYRTIAPLERVLVVTIVTKHLGFVFQASDQVFAHRCEVFALDRDADYSVLQSSVHEYWARYYSSTLESRINYSPSNCFETFPFPRPTLDQETVLEDVGKRYHELRARIMQRLQLGLTKTYNLFHTPDLAAAQVAKAARVTLNEEDVQQALREIEHLRVLHVEMDEAVKAAYGWDDLALGHGFHEVDFLPENDRVRYTISPEARKKILRRLLLLNHERYVEEQAKKKATQTR